MSKNVKISNPMKVITGASTRWVREDMVDRD